MSILGRPDKHLVQNIKSQSTQTALLRDMDDKRMKKTPLAHLLRNEDPEIAEVIQALIVYDPSKRLSARETLELPLFKSLRESLPEEKYPSPMVNPDMFEFEFENFRIGKEILGELLLDEILLYNLNECRE